MVNEVKGREKANLGFAWGGQLLFVSYEQVCKELDTCCWTTHAGGGCIKRVRLYMGGSYMSVECGIYIAFFSCVVLNHGIFSRHKRPGVLLGTKD